MHARLYRELVLWYPLLDPPADHADAVDCYEAALLGEVGYGVKFVSRPIGDDEFDEVFLGRRPGAAP